MLSVTYSESLDKNKEPFIRDIIWMCVCPFVLATGLAKRHKQNKTDTRVVGNMKWQVTPRIGQQPPLASDSHFQGLSIDVRCKSADEALALYPEIALTFVIARLCTAISKKKKKRQIERHGKRTPMRRGRKSLQPPPLEKRKKRRKPADGAGASSTASHLKGSYLHQKGKSSSDFDFLLYGGAIDRAGRAQ